MQNLPEALYKLIALVVDGFVRVYSRLMIDASIAQLGSNCLRRIQQCQVLPNTLPSQYSIFQELM